MIKGYVDVDNNDPRNVVGLTATNGTLTKVDNTKYTFKPNADYVGPVDLTYTITDGKGGIIDVSNTITISPVNDAPIRTAGDVTRLYLLEDDPIISMGLAGVTYSAGGGVDETTTNATKLNALVYKVKTLPAATFGKVFLSNGTTRVAVDQTLSLDELRGLKFEATANASGTADFEFCCHR